MRRLSLAFAALGLALSAPLVSPAPADAYQFVGTVTNERVKVLLEHSEVVAVANDWTAPHRICSRILQDVDHNRAYLSGVTIFTCAQNISRCAMNTVRLGLQTVYVTWWPGRGECSW